MINNQNLFIFRYKICSSKDLIRMHKIILNTHLNLNVAKGDIDTSPIQNPIWCTAGIRSVSQVSF